MLDLMTTGTATTFQLPSDKESEKDEEDAYAYPSGTTPQQTSQNDK